MPHYLAKVIYSNRTVKSFISRCMCSGVNLVRSVATDYDSCGMAKTGDHDFFFIVALH